MFNSNDNGKNEIQSKGKKNIYSNSRALFILMENINLFLSYRVKFNRLN